MMLKSKRYDRTRTQTRYMIGFCTSDGAGYIIKDGFWPAFSFYWQLRRHPGFWDVSFTRIDTHGDDEARGGER